jgi:hypothetical protein
MTQNVTAYVTSCLTCLVRYPRTQCLSINYVAFRQEVNAFFPVMPSCRVSAASWRYLITREARKTERADGRRLNGVSHGLNGFEIR